MTHAEKVYTKVNKREDQKTEEEGKGQRVCLPNPAEVCASISVIIKARSIRAVE
jgi:hypothetical protein